MNKREIGNIGEDKVCGYLDSLGINIIKRNYSCRYGEIDVIANDKGTIVFIEVKTRSNKNFGTPSESVTIAKQQKIIKTAKNYAIREKLTECDFRFDVAEVIKENNIYYINLIKNAFEVSDGI